MIKPTKINSIKAALIIALATIAPGAALAQKSSSGNGGIAFRKTTVGINSAAESAVAASVGGGSDVEDLSEKKATLETELRYGKAKLDAAQKKLSVQSAAGNIEQADRLNQEAKDWEARISSIKAQLDQVEIELKAAGGGSPLTGGGVEGEVVLPGENLELFVNEDSSFNGKYQVRRGGYIILPQVGRIPVAGKSLDQAEAAVKRALQSSQLQRATVMIERLSGSDVESGPLIYLHGEFKNPRPYRIPLGTSPTLVSVILSSGGVSERADLSRVRIMRMTANKGVTEIVNVQKILDGGGLTSDLALDQGDVVTIPAGSVNLIYVTGNVKRQGSYHLVPGERLTAYGAILQSGGFARFADEKKVHVLRAMPDGTKTKLPVNVVAIQRGQIPDVVLQSNDIIVVPEKWFSW